MIGTNAVITSGYGLTLDVEPEIRSGGNLLFFSSGEVLDPEAMIRLASFPGLAQPPFVSQPPNHICPDMASGRVYYFVANSATFAAYSLRACAKINSDVFSEAMCNSTWARSGVLEGPDRPSAQQRLSPWWGSISYSRHT